MDLDVGDRRRRQVLLQRLPVLALIERDVRALQRAGVEQSFLFGVLAHDVHRLVAGMPFVPSVSSVQCAP
jgi:hypothetical protein